MTLGAYEVNGEFYCSLRCANKHTRGMQVPNRISVSEYKLATDGDPVESRTEPNWGALCCECEDELPGYVA